MTGEPSSLTDFLSSQTVLQKLNRVCIGLLGERFRFDPKVHSSHWILFAAFSEIFRTKSHLDICELGTYDGQFTRLLDSLFDDAVITTVELDQEDPLYTEIYNRDDPIKKKRHQEILASNLSHISRSKLRFLQTNTLFIDSFVDSADRFDLIWVDASHNYPEIAWDVHFALRRVKVGGYIAIDDVKPYGSRPTKLGRDDAVISTVNYIGNRLKTNRIFLRKREGAEKYIAVFGPF